MLPFLLLPVLAPNLSRSLVVPHPDELGMPQQAISRPFHEGHFHNHLRLHPPQRRHVFGAVTNGDTPMVRLLLDAGANVDGSLGSGFTHLCWAAIYCRTAIVRLLLEAVASVSTRPSGYPLINFVTWGCHDERRLNEIVEVLRAAGARSRPDWWLRFEWQSAYCLHRLKRLLGGDSRIRQPPSPPPFALPSGKPD